MNDVIAPGVHEFLRLDLAPMLAVTFSAGTLGLLGAFLVLRRRAMIGDALAHSVLPGLVVSFLLTGTRAPLPTFVGAVCAAGLAAASIGLIARFGRVDASTSIGVVFTTMFALGILLVERSGARNVDLDLDCVLSGQLELLFWNPPHRWSELLSMRTLASLPGEVRTLGSLAVAAPVLLAAHWRLVRVSTFDPVHAKARGLMPGLVQGGLFLATTMAIVASFEALGSILVIALLTCPPAAARLMTTRLHSFALLSAGLGAFAGIAGYSIATRAVPTVIGMSVDASGAVAALAGLVLAGTALRSAGRKTLHGRRGPANEDAAPPAQGQP